MNDQEKKDRIQPLREGRNLDKPGELSNLFDELPDANSITIGASFASVHNLETQVMPGVSQGLIWRKKKSLARQLCPRCLERLHPGPSHCCGGSRHEKVWRQPVPDLQSLEVGGMIDFFGGSKMKGRTSRSAPR